MSASIWDPTGSTNAYVDAESTNLSQVFITTAAQTLFTITEFQYALGTGSLAVFRNGQRLVQDTDWQEVSTTSFLLLIPVAAQETIEAVGIIGSATEASAQAQATLAAFLTLYLGPHPANPLTDNVGNPLINGAIYWNTSTNDLWVYTGNVWVSGMVGLVTGIVDYVEFTTGVGAPSERKLSWNVEDGTLELGLAGGTTVLQLGQESHIRFRNNTVSTIPNGTVLYISGAASSGSPRISASPAQANLLATCESTIAIATEATLAGADGFGTSYGLVRNLDTSLFAVGAALYLSTTVAGGLTAAKPLAPNIPIRVGWCVSSHTSTGSIFVDIAGVGAGAGGAGATGAGGDQVFYENDKVVTTNYSITAGKNAGTFGPVTIANGVTVTVPNGSVWSIV